ncbi:MAG: heme lyase CcmF/NrfE family subunit [Candidatus Accumulibacter sp.]|jgi:cytochrome c-type biogenesis protein CcmF|nr:heme lyase CcmF/NrfE family subunit [Accumulibacter sp.]
MIPEFGLFALALAFVLALTQCVGLWRPDCPCGIARFARPAVFAQFLSLSVAAACLVFALASNDFSVAYVVRHSNTRLPLVYRIAAAWGGHEGSLLFWAYALAVWTLVFGVFSKSLSGEARHRVLALLGLVEAGLLLILLFTSNPFERVFPAVADGRDLNPLLQDPGLIVHPPMLYLGYSGLAIPFALAVESLISGAPDLAWARASRLWTIFAWVFLTLGIAIGSFWAYYELGWGGWWFWDPVENASLMPWLAATALIHALPVAEKRGAFRLWCLFLAIVAFALSLIGAFLVRSGVLISVHAFSESPQRGVSILAFLALVVGASLALFAWRAPRVSPGGRFAFASRETFLLVAGILAMVACASILLGTLYPLAIDTLGLGKISVGAPYFDTVFTPLAVSALFLTGAAINARWKRSDPAALIRRLRPTFLFALAFGLFVPAFFGAWKPLPALGLTLAAWIALSSVQNALTTMRVGASPTRLSLLRRLIDFGGTHVAHVGVAVLVAGITLANGYPDEKTFLFTGGETVEFANYAFRFNGVHGESGPNYHAFVADFDLGREGKILRKLLPEKRFYPTSGVVMTEAAIDFARDLYVALDAPVDRDAPEGAWRVRISRKPFVGWIWGGCALAALGGLLAAFGHCRAARRRAPPKTFASEIKPENTARPSSPT